MGIEARVVSGIGQIFDTSEEARSWFIENFKGIVPDDDRELLEDGLSDFLEGTDLKQMPKLVCLDLMSGQGFALLYPFEGGAVTDFRKSVENAIALWDKRFGSEARAISKVQWF
jgi:hypothetical protein